MLLDKDQVLVSGLQAGNSILRLYALVRTDLGMTPGKMATQTGHAFVETLRRCIQTDPVRERDYHALGIATKICLAVPSLKLLLQAHEHTQVLGLPCALITDQGHKRFFNGDPTVTALGIGPIRRHECRFLRRFSLVP